MFPRLTRSPRLAAPAAAAALVALLVLLRPAVVRGQALADRVPSDAVVYVGWQGADALADPYAKSRLRAVVDATDARQLLGDFIPELVAKAGQQDPQAADALKVFASLAKPMWRHPTAFFFAGVDREGQPAPAVVAPPGGPDQPAAVGERRREPIPKMALLCQAGDEAAALKRQIDDLMKQAPPDAQQHIKTYEADGLIGVSVGYADLGKALSGKGDNDKSLASDAAFKSALGHAGKQPAVVGYVDVARIVDLINTAVDREGPPDAKQNWPKAREALGLAGLKQIVWTSGFEDRDWADHVFIAAPGPHKGLMTMLDAGPVTDEALAAVPQTATQVAVGKFDAAKFLNTIRDIARDIDPKAGDQIDQGLKGLSDHLKVDLEKDFLASLGDEWAYYADPNTGGRGMLGMVVVNRLRDPVKATKSLAILEAFANAQLAEQMKNEQVKVAILQTKYGDLTIHYLGTPLVTPAWAIQGEYLIAALYPQTVAAAADHVRAKGKSIAENPDFVALRKRLSDDAGGVGGAKVSSIQFMDLPKSTPDSYGTWLLVSRLSGFADLFGVQSPAMLLPPLNRLLPQLAPAGAVTWTDADGWHARAVSPFPGATVLGNDPLAAYLSSAPVGMAMYLPAMRKAQFQAQRAREANNLRQIGIATQMYANDHKGEMPSSLGELIKGKYVESVDVFLDPNARIEPKPEKPDEQAEWVDEHAAYKWLGKGVKLEGVATADKVIAHEKLEEHFDGVNVLFADGHVEWLNIEEARRVIAGGKRDNDPRIETVPGRADPDRPEPPKVIKPDDLRPDAPEIPKLPGQVEPKVIEPRVDVLPEPKFIEDPPGLTDAPAVDLPGPGLGGQDAPAVQGSLKQPPAAGKKAPKEKPAQDSKPEPKPAR